MASLTCIMAETVAALLIVAAAIDGAGAQGDSDCADRMSRLNVCAPFMVAGNSSAPSSECCAALGGVDRDCLCNTLRIVNQLPSQFQLPSFNCPSSVLPSVASAEAFHTHNNRNSEEEDDNAASTACLHLLNSGSYNTIGSYKENEGYILILEQKR